MGGGKKKKLGFHVQTSCLNVAVQNLRIIILTLHEKSRSANYGANNKQMVSLVERQR